MLINNVNVMFLFPQFINCLSQDHNMIHSVLKAAIVYEFLLALLEKQQNKSVSRL